MPNTQEPPKWALVSKTVIGILIMLSGKFLPEYLDVFQFLEGVIGTGVIGVGALLALFGRKYANSQIYLWKNPNG